MDKLIVALKRARLPPVTTPPQVLRLGAALALVISCSAPPSNAPQPPLGLLPSAVTSAEPLWVPFQVRAGKPVSVASPSPLLQLRQLTFDGNTGAGVFTPDGLSVVFERGPGGGKCSSLVALDLQTGRERTLRLGQPIAAGPGFARDASLLSFSGSSAPLPCSVWGSSPDGPFSIGLTRAIGAPTAAVPPAAGAPTAAAAPALSLPPAAAASRRSSHALAYPLSDPPPTTGDSSRRVSGAHHQGWPTLTPDGSVMIFTSTRDGDPELYATTPNATLQRLTHAPGFDGGARLSADGSRLLWHAAPARTPAARDALQRQLRSGVVTPPKLVIMLAGAHGQHPHVVAAFGRYSAMPTFAPDSRHILFASDRDHHGDGPTNFDIYRVDPDGPVTSLGHPRLQRLTYHQAYDGAPDVSPDGQWLLFTSSRGSKAGHTNLFVARLPAP